MFSSPSLPLIAPSIRFCETPYARYSTISEYFNTLSSLSYIIVGLLYLKYILCDKIVLPKDYQVFISLHLVLIGCGSALFHAIPRFDMELLDELPMLSLMFVLMYYVIDKHPWLSLSVPLHRRMYYALFLGVGCTTMKYVITRDYAYFFMPFTVLLVINIGVYGHYCCMVCAMEKERQQLKHALALLLCSQIAWQIEQYLVRHEIQSIHCNWLHAVWHVLSALCLYVWLV